MSVLFRLASTPMKWARDSATTGGTRIDPAITRPIAIPHWIPYSYKLLVPKSSGHIPQFSREQLKDFLDGLDCDCLVPLPNDVQEYMLQRRMYSEIDYWRAELSKIRKHIIRMKLTPEQAARELRIFWGPMNESQITEEIKEFYRSRSFRDCDIIFENNDYGRNGGVERVGEPYTSGFWKQQSVTTRKVPLRGLHSFQSTSRPYTNSGLQTHTFGRATAREPVSSRGIVYKTVRGRNQGDTVFSRTQPTVGFQAPQSNPFTLQPNPFTTQTNPLTTQTNVFTTQTNTLNTQPPRAFQNTNIPNIPTTRNNINNTLPRQAPTPRIVISAKEEPRGLIHSIARLLLPWGTGPQNQNNSIDIPARASDPRPQVRPSYPMLIRNSLHRYFTSEGSEVPLPPVPGMITAPPVTSTSFPLYNLLPAGVSSSTRSTSPAPHPVFAFQPITTPPQYTTSTTHHRRVDPIQYYLEWVGYTLHLDTLAWETIDFMAFLTFVPWAIVMFVFWLAHFLGFVIP